MRLTINLVTIVNSLMVVFLASTINSQDKVVPVGGELSLTCTSSVSSNVAFVWTRNRMPVSGVSDSNGGTSTLTLSDVKIDDAGNYVCSVRVSTLVVMSDPITIDTVIIGMLIRKSPVTLANWLHCCCK